MPLYVASRKALMGAPSTLFDGLVAYWKLNEASDGSGAVTRADATGRGNTLTDNNTVPSAAGLVYSNALSHNRVDNDFLSVVDNSDVSVGNVDWTGALWLYPTNITACRWPMGKGNYDAYATLEWGFDIASSKVLLRAGNNGGGETTVTATTLGNLSNNTWYLVIAWHDAAGDTINICVNAGAADSAACTHGLYDSTQAFRIGSDGSGRNWEGRIGPAMLWKRVLNAGERAELYAGGAGVQLF